MTSMSSLRSLVFFTSDEFSERFSTWLTSSPVWSDPLGFGYIWVTSWHSGPLIVSNYLRSTSSFEHSCCKTSSMEVNRWRDSIGLSLVEDCIGNWFVLASFSNLFSLFPGYSLFGKLLNEFSYCSKPLLRLSGKLLDLNGGWRVAFAADKDWKGAKRSSVVS